MAIEIDLDYQPQETAQGGIVSLGVTLQEAGGGGQPRGVYLFTWQTEGPVASRTGELSRALTISSTQRSSQLGRTTTEEQIVVLDPAQPIRASWDTSDVPPGSYSIDLDVALQEPNQDLRDRLAQFVKIDDATWTEFNTVFERNKGGLTASACAAPVIVNPRPFKSGDDVFVTMRRTAVAPTKDQSLWAVIRNATQGLNFDSFTRFMDVLACGDDEVLRGDRPALHRPGTKRTFDSVRGKLCLPFPDIDPYRVLKAAAEVFMMVYCGVSSDTLQGIDLADESLRFNRIVEPGEIEAIFQDYLVQAPDGPGGPVDTLPYLALVRAKLRDVTLTNGSAEDRAAMACFGILREKLANPCFLELLWSYWHEEAMLVQTMNAISWRFQNRRRPGTERDPLAALEIDPLRPLNNLLWGFVQDELFRLTLPRRAYEYDHHYGLTLIGKAVRPPVQGADSRSRFLEAFHHLLHLVSIFYKEDDDTTVMADGFPVLNGLKEVHLLLTQGAHNQYGDLPWVARQEMLMMEWLLARPEMREFLPTRVMVAYPEPWMDRVEAMKTLQGWSSTPVLHFRDLGIFGEQVLLSIRFGAWTTVIESESAANWARYWRPEIQGYIHAYRAVTGVDLTESVETTQPAVHLRRRLAAEAGRR